MCVQQGEGLWRLVASGNMVVATQLTLVEFKYREITFYNQDSLRCSLNGEYLLEVTYKVGSKGILLALRSMSRHLQEATLLLMI